MPPTRNDLSNLCKALNIRITDRKCIEAILYMRGPEMEKSRKSDFLIEKLIHWFQLNLQYLEHDNLELVDTEWLLNNP